MAVSFDESHIQQILQSVNIIEVVGRYLSLSRQGKEMVGICPFHDDRKPSMKVNAAKQIFKCFACGAGGNVIQFLMRRERMSFPEAVIFLADQAGIELPKRQGGEKVVEGRKRLEQASTWAAQQFRRNYEEEDEGLRARQYGAQRGIQDDTARRFGLGWAPAEWDHLKNNANRSGQDIGSLTGAGLLVEKDGGGHYDRFRERLIFPVISQFGKVIAFGGRTLGDDSAKYLNSPESDIFDKSRALYGLHLAKDAIVKQRTAIVVEGYMDCIMAHQQGVTHVVATLGTALTQEHARALGRYADRIVLVFDPDEAGEKAANRAIDIFFAQKIEVRLVTLPRGMDPCDFLLAEGKDAFLALVDAAKDALSYKWEQMSRAIDASDTIQGQTRAVDAFLEVVAKAFAHGQMDDIARGFVLNQIAKLVDAPVSSVQGKVETISRRLSGRRDSGNEPAWSGRQDTVLSSHIRALQEILEVLLNRPDLFDRAKDEIETANLDDSPLGRLTKRVWNTYETDDQTGISGVLASCEEMELCDFATELADRGNKRGNYEQTMDGALSYLRFRRAEQANKRLSEQVSEAADKYGADAERALLGELAAKHRPDPRRTAGNFDRH